MVARETTETQAETAATSRVNGVLRGTVRAPTVVINGSGETFGLFGPGNDPITGNAINDTDPYYFTTDEDVTIFFDW